jgi:hypothetical protein
MKGFIAGIILTFIVGQAYAQTGFSLSHQVMVPAAGIITAGGTSYQQTVGEAAVEIFVLSPHILTQGFQQPRFVPSEDTTHFNGNGVAFYPNPLRESVNYVFNIRVYGEISRNYNLIITNLAGSVIFTGNADLYGKHDYIYPVDMSSFSNGIYVARVISTDGLINRSFKVAKL